ncbi:hypothetical protein WAF00_15330 [Mameliella alba]|uniref:hypothetical protein n=1 Tax=Mameliella alba TaxID=561184 RepID=UPI003012CADD
MPDLEIWLSYFRLAGFWLMAGLLLVPALAVVMSLSQEPDVDDRPSQVVFLALAAPLGVVPVLLNWKYGRRKGPILTLTAQGILMNAIDPEAIIPWRDIDVRASWHVLGGWRTILTFRCVSRPPKEGRRVGAADLYELRIPNIATKGCLSLQRLARSYKTATMTDEPQSPP